MNPDTRGRRTTSVAVYARIGLIKILRNSPLYAGVMILCKHFDNSESIFIIYYILLTINRARFVLQMLQINEIARSLFFFSSPDVPPTFAVIAAIQTFINPPPPSITM